MEVKQMENKNAVELFQMKVAHVGMNAENEAQAMSWAKEFFEFLGLKTRETPNSVFIGELVEIMKENGRGEKGHIGFSVNNCEEALAYFETRGIHSIEETKKFDSQGKCYFAYLDREIGGFAIHLIQQ